MRRGLAWFCKPPVTVGITAAIAGIGVAAGPAGRWELVAASVLLVAICGLLVLRLRTDPLDAPGVYALATAVLFGVTSLAWLSTPGIPGPGLDRDDITSALLVVSLGVSAFAVGSWLVYTPKPHPTLIFGGGLPSVRALGIAYLIGVGSLALGIFLKTYGYVTTAGVSTTVLSVVQLFASLGTIATLVTLCAALVYFRTGDRQLGRMLTTFVVIQVVLGFVIGYKGASLDPLLVTLLAYVAIRRRVPWRFVGLAMIATFVVLLPANTAYRASLREGSGGTVSALTRTLTKPELYRPDNLVSDAYVYASYRFRLIDSPALIVANTPSQYPYAHGTRYLELPLTLAVPRVLWPEKPVLDDSTQFSSTYWQIPPSRHTATGLTQVGDLYRNFGLLGVGVGMFAWGAVLGGCSRLYRRWYSPRAEMIWLYALLKAVIYVEADLPFLLAYWLKTLPFVVGVAWLLLPGRTASPGYQTMGRLLGRNLDHRVESSRVPGPARG